MANGRNGIKIESSTSYDFDVIQGRIYGFEVFYDTSATATVTVSQGGFDDSGGTELFQEATLPLDPTAAMAITATGVARGFDLRATAKKMRFTSGVVSGDIYLRFQEVAHGRS